MEEPAAVHYFFIIMARNAAGKTKQQKQQENHPDVKYNKLDLARQIACYNFWIHLDSNAKQGWDPVDAPGSTWKWRSSNFIKAHIKKTSWNKIGKVRNA